jgi:hypothetical protein
MHRRREARGKRRKTRSEARREMCERRGRRRKARQRQDIERVVKRSRHITVRQLRVEHCVKREVKSCEGGELRGVEKEEMCGSYYKKPVFFVMFSKNVYVNMDIYI